MKKKYIILSLTLIFSSLVFAQTEGERQKIRASYDIEKIENLIQTLKEKNLAKEKRISAYLNANFGAERKIIVGGKNYVIYDIQDGKPVYRTTTNINSAKGTRTDKLHNGGSLSLNLEGQNMSIGVWDEESALGTHDEFEDNQVIPQSRVVYPEFNGGPFIGTTSDHATHVAGTLIAKGVDADAKGMAPQALLRSFDWNSDDVEAATEAASGLLLSNHSYGIPLSSVSAANVGAYVSDARVWDQVAYAAPYYLPVKSAGNNGTDTYSGGIASGYDKLTGNKTAKNALIVANANPFLLANGNFILNINPGSSQGPTDDFRVKPDIAGDGSSVYSSTNANNSDYSTFSGTSMAAPNVSGTCLLLQQYYNQLNSNYMRAATLKGLICHTAVDDTRTGPDPIYGWGFLDAEAAANIIQDNNAGNSLIREVILNDGDTYTYEFSAGTSSELRATICWTDPAGATSSSPGNILSPRLVNDLDLRIEDASSTIFTPWKLDNTNVAAAAIKGDNNVDNIERIDIASPVGGNYTLTVTHKGSLTNSSQAFSIIITGANLTLSSKKNAFSTLKVWPIPASTKINIQYKTLLETSKLMLYNINGSLVFKDDLPISLSDNYTINTSKLSKGIYFLNIASGNSKYIKKIIIK
ncbi:S8 family serine peptidase [Flaviramulus sp. BrNp1-15]|uniref:S8 family serine peptidase n=1 Tax=Flaviramulus sp. BrNp1-15 TaxID=2916754 RepID=UPI001EE87E7D|nr:S8 family serine peptidase [Flaviramulus sp. BrNp1-15]ULC60224.1 S8 family serine peptidase [Flaviramulus sp. BrNp1-15]